MSYEKTGRDGNFDNIVRDGKRTKTTLHTPPNSVLPTDPQSFVDRMKNLLVEYEHSQDVCQFESGYTTGLHGKNMVKKSLQFNDPIDRRQRLFPELDIDIFDVICATMPQEKLVANYLFDTRYNSTREVFVHHCGTTAFMLTRKAILTLGHITPISEEVITYVALTTWMEAQTDESRRCNWTFPPSFAQLASLNYLSDDELNLRVFGQDRLFLGAPETCETISFPIDDEGHWYLCTVDITGSTVIISDTGRTETTYASRMRIAKCAVERLEKLATLWGMGNFKNSNWSGFRYMRSYAPQDGLSHDAGLYVIVMLMFPGVLLRSLTKGESISTRERLAIKIYRSKFNEKEQGHTISYVILSDFGEHRVNYFFSPDTTLGETLEHILNVLELNTRLDVLPTLKTTTPAEHDLVTLNNDFDLHHVVNGYIKENFVTIPLTLEMVPMPRSHIWFLVKRSGYRDLLVGTNPSIVDLETLQGKIWVTLQLQDPGIRMRSKDQILKGKPVVGSRLLRLDNNNVLKKFVKSYTDKGRSMIKVYYNTV